MNTTPIHTCKQINQNRPSIANPMVHFVLRLSRRAHISYSKVPPLNLISVNISTNYLHRSRNKYLTSRKSNEAKALSHSQETNMLHKPPRFSYYIVEWLNFVSKVNSQIFIPHKSEHFAIGSICTCCGFPKLSTHSQLKFAKKIILEI